MFRPAAVIWSKVPEFVTFGAGGGVCAKAGSAGIAKMTNARTAMTRLLLLITASSSGGEKHRKPAPALNADITNDSSAIEGPERSRIRGPCGPRFKPLETTTRV
jgi:hypothetical protein